MVLIIMCIIKYVKDAINYDERIIKDINVVFIYGLTMTNYNNSCT